MSVVQMNNSSNEQQFKRTIVQTAVVQMRIHRNDGIIIVYFRSIFSMINYDSMCNIFRYLQFQLYFLNLGSVLENDFKDTFWAERCGHGLVKVKTLSGPSAAARTCQGAERCGHMTKTFRKNYFFLVLFQGLVRLRHFLGRTLRL